MTENMTVAETLNKAADYLERFGWTQLDGSNPGWWDRRRRGISRRSKATCAMLAMGRVNPTPYRYKAHHAFILYLGGDIESRIDVIGRWNDHPDRTATEVVEALRACAVIAESRETSGLPGVEVGAK